MPVALLCLGIASVLVGLLMAYGGYVNFDFSYGGTLAIAASVAILGGLVVIGIAACLAQLRRIAGLLTATVGNTTGAVSSRSGGEPAEADEERRLPVLPPRPPRPPRPADEQGEAPTGPPSPRPAARVELEPLRSGVEAAPASLQTPELPRIGPADRFGSDDAGEAAGEPRGLSAERAAPAFDDISPSQPYGSPILKSGVIEGMAYTLYADGSVEAELPQGIMRFGSVAEWRDYLRSEA